MSFLNPDGSATIPFLFTDETKDEKTVRSEGTFSYKITDNTKLNERLSLEKQESAADTPAIVKFVTKTVHGNIRAYLQTIDLYPLMGHAKMSISDTLINRFQSLHTLEKSGIAVTGLSIALKAIGHGAVECDEERNRRLFEDR